MGEGVAHPPGRRPPQLTIWAVAAFMAANTLGNLAAPRPLERFGMRGITLWVGILAVLVALAV